MMPAIDLIDRNECPVCSQPEAQELYRASFGQPALSSFLQQFYKNRYDHSLSNRDYILDQCQRCSLIFQRGVLNDPGMMMLYDHWIDNEASLRKKQSAKPKTTRQYARVIDAIGRYFPRSPGTVRVLDFGMGWGYWAHMAQSHGYDVTGLEYSENRLAHARSIGVNAVKHLSTGEQMFDFVLANQVLEHVPDPRQTLQTIAAHLAHGGIAHIRVPDGRGVAKKIRAHGWSGEIEPVHPLEHINCFTRPSLIRLARNCGLKPISPPLQVSMDRLWSSLKREWVDRFVTTHVFVQKRQPSV
ncbi:MAG: class I SAM-dependent methyltransferase [Pseudomonadota bacterium]